MAIELKKTPTIKIVLLILSIFVTLVFPIAPILWVIGGTPAPGTEPSRLPLVFTTMLVYCVWWVYHIFYVGAQLGRKEPLNPPEIVSYEVLCERVASLANVSAPFEFSEIKPGVFRAMWQDETVDASGEKTVEKSKLFLRLHEKNHTVTSISEHSVAHHHKIFGCIPIKTGSWMRSYGLYSWNADGDFALSHDGTAWQVDGDLFQDSSMGDLSNPLTELILSAGWSVQPRIVLL